MPAAIFGRAIGEELAGRGCVEEGAVPAAEAAVGRGAISHARGLVGDGERFRLEEISAGDAELSIDDELVGKGRAIDFAVRHGRRGVFGEVAEIIARGVLFAVPEFRGEVRGVEGVEDARLGGIVRIAAEDACAQTMALLVPFAETECCQPGMLFVTASKVEVLVGVVSIVVPFQ